MGSDTVLQVLDTFRKFPEGIMHEACNCAKSTHPLAFRLILDLLRTVPLSAR